MEPTAKSQLQKLCSDRKLPAPTYRTKAVEGEFSATVSVGIGKGKAIRPEAEIAETSSTAEEAAAEAFLGKYGDMPDLWWAVIRSRNDSTVQMLQEICQRMGIPVPVYRSKGRDRNWWGSCQVRLAGREFYMEGRGSFPRDISHVLAGMILTDLKWIKSVTPRSGQKPVEIIDPSRHQRR
jgi:dsRNA-specific ribonuclease